MPAASCTTQKLLQALKHSGKQSKSEARAKDNQNTAACHGLVGQPSQQDSGQSGRQRGLSAGAGKSPGTDSQHPQLWVVEFCLFGVFWFFVLPFFFFLDRKHVSKLWGCHNTESELRIQICLYIKIYILCLCFYIYVHAHPSNVSDPPKTSSLTTRTKPSLSDHSTVRNQHL